VTRLADCEDILAAWDDIPLSTREQLRDHFVSDGIEKHAFMLMFLPDVLAGARKNSNVGLVPIFLFLEDLLRTLYDSAVATGAAVGCVQVDLDEIKKLVNEVSQPSDFHAVFGNYLPEKRIASEDLVVTVSSDVWRRIYFKHQRSEQDLFCNVTRDVKLSLAQKSGFSHRVDRLEDEVDAVLDNVLQDMEMRFLSRFCLTLPETSWVPPEFQENISKIKRSASASREAHVL
jgi:hypothetical protein